MSDLFLSTGCPNCFVDAQISPLHANFIANTGGATASDVRRLMERAREAVEKACGVRLEPEVRIVGREA